MDLKKSIRNLGIVLGISIGTGLISSITTIQLYKRTHPERNNAFVSRENLNRPGLPLMQCEYYDYRSAEKDTTYESTRLCFANSETRQGIIFIKTFFDSQYQPLRASYFELDKPLYIEHCNNESVDSLCRSLMNKE
ncbi:MAG: hypothetical protein AABX19_00490 [Nanoarchaeota archaeon]